MKKIVLDSSALIAYFEAEEGGKLVAEKLKMAADDKIQLLLSVVNLGEVYYVTLRSYDQEFADKVLYAVQHMPISVIDADMAITKVAAAYKAQGGISYGDCFAAALATNYHAELMTTDREFKKLENRIKILWVT